MEWLFIILIVLSAILILLQWIQIKKLIKINDGLIDIIEDLKIKQR